MNVNEILEKFKKSSWIALDTETESLVDKTMVGFSLSDGKHTYYLPTNDRVLENVPKEEAILLLNSLFTRKKIIFHNSSFDIPVLAKFGADTSRLYCDDTLIIINLLDENMRHGLKFLVKRYFDYQMTELKEICGTGKSRISFADVKTKDKVLYAKDDALWTFKLYQRLIKELEADKELMKVYREVEQPLLKIVGDMHSQGILIDVAKVKEIADICKKKIDLNEQKLKIVMGDINFNSPKQLKEYFIDKLHLPVLKNSKRTNAPSVDKEVLKAYADMNTEAKLLLEYRKYMKIYTTFIPALTPSGFDIETMTGKIYPSFNQAGTVSGRFSSSRPNMQNIPRKDELEIRQTILPDKGQILIGADYSQIELRVLAYFSQDPNLVKAYIENKDIHEQTAKACGVNRQEAKTINFGLVYGMRNKTLAKQINKSLKEAQQYIERYFHTYQFVKKFWQDAETQYKKFGFVKTVTGRKRHRSRRFFTMDDFDQGGEIRSATNSIIQGSAADIIKLAMIYMASRLAEFNARIISTVHDEVLVSCPLKHANSCYQIVKSSMLRAGKLLAPIPVDIDIKYGRTWEEAHGDGIDEENIFELLGRSTNSRQPTDMRRGRNEL